MYPGKLTDIDGILVGHAQDDEAMTGVTAIVFEDGAVCAVDVRGGGPGTRETDALAPGRLVDKADAILLCGGSAFGLAAADGAMAHLESIGRGYETGFARVPIVPAAVLYDLGCGRADVRPNAQMGADAVRRAGADVLQGRVGAGRGATVGKLVPGAVSAPGGVGTAAIHLPGGAVIAALAAVNAVGDIYDPTSGAPLACGTLSGAPVNAMDRLLAGAQVSAEMTNTTLGVIATNVSLSREQLSRLALIAHDGYARAIRPVHLPVDGDTVFAASTCAAEGDYMMLAALAAEVMARAIANAVLAK